MITRVKLKNWKSHLDSDLSFSKGVNVLTGIMGSGKTSVVEAISFVLFGTFPALQSRRVGLDDLIMNRPQKKDQAEVEVEFSVDSKGYLVRRVVERGKGTVSAEIREGGRLLDVNPRNVTEAVERLLQIDYDLFSKAVCSEQNGLDYFLNIPKGQRMQHIDRLLKLEQYERVRERAVSLRNRVRDRDKDIAKLLEDMEKEGLEEKLGSVRKELKELKNRMKGIEAGLKAMGEGRKALEKSVESAEDADKKLTGVVKEIEAISSALEEIGSSIKEKTGRLGDRDVKLVEEEAGKLEEGIGSLKEKLADKRISEKKLREEVASLNTRLMIAEKKGIPELKGKIEEKEKHLKVMEELEKGQPDIESAVRKKKSGLEKQKRLLYQRQSRTSELKAQLENLESDTCPTCSSRITEEVRKKVKREKLSELRELEEEIVSAQKSIEKAEEDLENLEARHQDFLLLKQKAEGIGELEKQLRERGREVETLRMEIRTKAEELEKLSGGLERLEAELKDKDIERERLLGLVEEARALEVLKGRKLKNRERVARLEVEKAGLEKKLSGVDIPKLRKELQEKVAEEREMQASLQALEEKVGDRVEKRSELEERQKAVEGYRKRREVNEEVVKELKGFEDALRLTQQQLREEFVSTVNFIMREIWPTLYPYGDLTDIKLGVDGDYTLQLRRGSDWLSADGIVSGGERSVACLALRIAFSIAFIPNLKWLILDEPTHNLDSNAIEQFSKALLENVGQFAEQVFIITHEDMSGLESVYRLERNKEAGEPTRVAAG